MKPLDSNVPQNLSPFHVLTMEQARKLCGLSKNTWINLENSGDAPVKLQLSKRRVGYLVQDIVAWLEKRRSAIAA
jgi:predicted DNA-binding transcriptional regulator AlpA